MGLSGGLGNQLFQFAAGLSLAMEHDKKLLVDKRWLDKIGVTLPGTRRKFALHRFNLPITIAGTFDLVPHRALSAAKRLRLRSISEKMEREWVAHIRQKSYQFENLSGLVRVNSYLNGLWHSPRYFLPIEEALRGMLTPVSEVPRALTEFRQMANDSGAICVNVRRGDYALNQGPARPLEVGYYLEGISTLTKKTGSQKVFIFSDDPAWCSQNFLQRGLNCEIVDHRFAGPDFSHYLYLMSGFRNFVISNSTFAWWAAWLAGEDALNVVVPQNWFNAAPDIDTRDLIPTSWHGIENKILS